MPLRTPAVCFDPAACDAARQTVARVRRRAHPAWSLLGTVAAGLALIVAMVAPWRNLRHPWGLAAEIRAPAGPEARPEWSLLGVAIASPDDLAPFEPLLEELAGAPPLSHRAVAFAPRSAAYTGRYRFWSIEIYGAEETRGREATYVCPESPVCGLDLCRGAPSSWRAGAYKGRVLATWAHEQGHHYARSPLRWTPPGAQRRFVDQVEAEALAFAFAEQMGRLDPRLGRHLMGLRLKPVTTPLMQLKELSRDRLVGRIAWPDPDEKDAWIGAVLALRASGLADFGAVWRYVHDHRPAAVAEAIQRHAGDVGEGHRLAVEAFASLAGRRLPRVPHELEPALPSQAAPGFVPGPAVRGCAQVQVGDDTLSFCSDGQDARIDLEDGSSGEARFRIGTDWYRPCLAVGGRSGSDRGWLVLEGRRASLKAVAAGEDPCWCRTEETLLSGDDMRDRMEAIAPAVGALVAEGLAALADAEDADGLGLARSVVSQVGAAHPALELPLTFLALGEAAGNAP